MSSTTFESPEEERRLKVNESKILKVWKQWVKRLDDEIPRFSTTKPRPVTDVSSDRRRRHDKSSTTDVNETKRGTCMLPIRNTIGQAKCKQSNRVSVSTRTNSTEKIACLRKTCSDSKLREATTTMDTCFVVRSEPKVRSSGVSMVISGRLDHATFTKDQGSEGNCEYPRMKKSNFCPEFRMGGEAVDESMGEFLANVDQDNMNDFLKFYNRMTREISSNVRMG